MTAAKHTPGPWMAAAAPSSVVGWPVVAQGGQSVCSLTWLGVKPADVSDERFAAYRAEVEANGQMIAAAPDLLRLVIAAADMLEELEPDPELEDPDEDLTAWLERAADVLGRVTGRTLRALVDAHNDRAA